MWRWNEWWRVRVWGGVNGCFGCRYGFVGFVVRMIVVNLGILLGGRGGMVREV